jgi:hypothetical protein
MRLVRRASLVFSLVLIVAIVVGYAVRTSEIARDRDASLASSAQLGSARLSALIDATSVASRSADGRSAANTDAIAEALADVHPGLGFCVVDASVATCAGDGPMPTTADVEDEQRRRAEGADVSDVATEVSVYDSLMSIDAVGPHITVLAAAPANIVDGTPSRRRRSSRPTSRWAGTPTIRASARHRPPLPAPPTCSSAPSLRPTSTCPAKSSAST